MKKHELLEKAIRDYPNGVEFYSTSLNGTKNKAKLPYFIDEYGCVKDANDWILYFKLKDRWAQIVKEGPTINISRKNLSELVKHKLETIRRRVQKEKSKQRQEALNYAKSISLEKESLLDQRDMEISKLKSQIEWYKNECTELTLQFRKLKTENLVLDNELDKLKSKWYVKLFGR